jgi:hypothetical protein
MWSFRSDRPHPRGGHRPTPSEWVPLRLDRVDEYRWLTALAGLLVIGVALLGVLGVPPVDLHGPLHYLGIMDPLCGATRATYLSVHGRLREAVTYNPGAPILLVAAGVILLRAAIGAVSHRWLTVRVPRRIGAVILVAALVVLEINQQSHAGLLTSKWTG